MPTLNEQLEALQKQATLLQNKIEDLSRNVESKSTKPYSKVGAFGTRSRNRPVEIKTGLGGTYGGVLAWNNSELQSPPYGTQPPTPTTGYNKHGHSRYAGGALDLNTLELVQYETNESGQLLDEDGNIINKHCQQFWTVDGQIETAEVLSDNGQNSEFVPKIGKITNSIVFDGSDEQFKFFAVYAEEEEA